MTDAFTELIAILAQDFDVSKNEVERATVLDDLGVDSVATAELAHIIKEVFGVTIGDDEMTSKSTIGQVVSLIEAGT